MTISDNLNWYDNVSYTEKTDLSSNVNVTDEDESKQIIVHETLSENISTERIHTITISSPLPEQIA